MDNQRSTAFKESVCAVITALIHVFRQRNEAFPDSDYQPNANLQGESFEMARLGVRRTHTVRTRVTKGNQGKEKKAQGGWIMLVSFPDLMMQTTEDSEIL